MASEKTIEELRTEKIEKTDDNLSTVISASYTDPGHILRVNFTKYLDSLDDFQIDVYGRCQSLSLKNFKYELPPNSKCEGLYKYKYTIAIETIPNIIILLKR